MLKQIRSFFRVLKSRDDFERGMSEELRFHVDQYVADLLRAGVPHPEAARRARIEFGSLNSTQEECREARAATVRRITQATPPRGTDIA